MLGYVKTILQKVAFDGYLFEKELRKSLTRLLPAEVEQLRMWCYEQFSHLHQLTMDRVFMAMA